MRTIDADELKKKLEAEHCDCEIMALIDDIPTAAEAANAKAACMSKAHTIMQHYGTEHQKDILIEECAELIQAVEKSRRQPDAPELTADMVEELADVYIMITQFQSIMGFYWSEVFDRTVEDKLRRQLERIESEEG